MQNLFCLTQSFGGENLCIYGKAIESDPKALPNKPTQTNERKAEASPGSYHGNVNSHIFHRSNCKHYNCKSCIKQFCSREDAISAGY